MEVLVPILWEGLDVPVRLNGPVQYVKQVSQHTFIDWAIPNINLCRKMLETVKSTCPVGRKIYNYIGQ